MQIHKAARRARPDAGVVVPEFRETGLLSSRDAVEVRTRGTHWVKAHEIRRRAGPDCGLTYARKCRRANLLTVRNIRCERLRRAAGMEIHYSKHSPAGR